MHCMPQCGGSCLNVSEQTVQHFGAPGVHRPCNECRFFCSTLMASAAPPQKVAWAWGWGSCPDLLVVAAAMVLMVNLLLNLQPPIKLWHGGHDCIQLRLE